MNSVFGPIALNCDEETEVFLMLLTVASLASLQLCFRTWKTDSSCQFGTLVKA